MARNKNLQKTGFSRFLGPNVDRPHCPQKAGKVGKEKVSCSISIRTNRFLIFGANFFFIKFLFRENSFVSILMQADTSLAPTLVSFFVDPGGASPMKPLVACNYK